MPRGAHRKRGAPGLPGAGPPRKYTTLRVPIASGRFPVALPVETIGLAQRLLLEYPECAGVEDVIALAVERLAANSNFRRGQNY